MSRTTARTPYCKVCHDAGKPSSIYNSHYVKDTTGKVVCPTLNAVECRYCYKKGHTVKYCNVLKKNETLKKEQVKIVAKRTPATPANKFSALYNYDVEEPIPVVEEPIPVVEEPVKEPIIDEAAFPSLCAPVKKQTQNAFSFAAAAAAAPVAATSITSNPYVHVKMVAPKNDVYTLNWADDDSEDDNSDNDW
jgi:Nanos RNA binding domain